MTANDIKSKWINKIEHGTPADEAVKCAVDETVANYKVIESNNVALVKKCDALKSRIEAEKDTTPITAEFLRRNFRDFKTNRYSTYALTAATTAEQTAISVDVFLREEGDAMVYVYGELDNVLNVHTVGELITFLNLCGLQSFTSTLKM